MRIRPLLKALTLLATCCPTITLTAGEPSARERLEAMSAEEKEDLVAKRERFESLSADEQARLRQLNRQLESDSNAEQLRAVMNRYYEWLKTLSSDQRAQLLSTTGAERIEMIHRFTEEQEKERFRRLADQKLSEEDLKQVYDWTTVYMRSRENLMIAALSEEDREEVREIEDEQRRWRKIFWMLRSRELPPEALPTPKEVEALISKLSTTAKEIFAAAPDEHQRAELVQRWYHASLFSRAVQSISEEELIAFMQKELDPRIREHLEGLERDDMQRQLRFHYFRHKFHGPGDGPSRFGPPGGGRPPRERGEERGDDGRRNDNRGPEEGRRRGPPPDRPPPDAPPTEEE